MPTRPKKPCQHPGCPNLVDGKYCDKHKPLHTEAARSASRRGYNYKWQQESKKFLTEHSLCVLCLKTGKFVQATVVDHKIPHRGNQKLFWDRKNWRPLCKHCHDTKTGTGDSTPEYKY